MNHHSAKKSCTAVVKTGFAGNLEGTSAKKGAACPSERTVL